jgi:SnoaL-like domain
MAMPVAPLTADDRLAIAALLTEFYRRLDHPEEGTVADLFTADGTIVTPRFQLAGREAIAQWFAARPRRTTRHSCSNLRLVSSAEDGVLVDAYLTTAAASASTEPGGAELLIGETHDHVVRGEAGAWLFVSRRLITVFEGRLGAGGGH